MKLKLPLAPLSPYREVNVVPMEIAIICPGQHAAASERSSSVERVAAEMSRRLPDSYRVTIYSRRLQGTLHYERIGNVIHRRIRAASRSSYIQQVLRCLREQPPDLIQIENRPFLVKQFRRRFPRIPLLLSLHSTTFVQPRTYGREAIRSCLKQASRIIVNSEYLAVWLQHQYRLKPNHLHICHPGTDVQRFMSKYTPQGAEQAQLLREELGYEEKKIVLYMGRLVPIKGVHHLLDVWPQVISEHDDAVLVICGSAKYGSDQLTPYVRQLHLAGNRMPRHVRFVPYVPHSMVPAWYQAADVVVTPSAEQEAFGLVNAEALACATPVVSTRTGGIVEVIQHGVNGWLIEPKQLRKQLGTVLNKLLCEGPLREQYGRDGAAWIRQRYTWERTAEKYAELYEQYAPMSSGR